MNYDVINYRSICCDIKLHNLPPQGKFTVEEFEQIGTINSTAPHEFNLDQLEDKPWRNMASTPHEFNLDQLEDKPWRKPGADITDYFNYGFTEETWRAYCERQKRIRCVESGKAIALQRTHLWRAYCERQKRIRCVESGVGLAALNPNMPNYTPLGPPAHQQHQQPPPQQHNPPPQHYPPSPHPTSVPSLVQPNNVPPPQIRKPTTSISVLGATVPSRRIDEEMGAPNMSVPPPGMQQPPPHMQHPDGSRKRSRSRSAERSSRSSRKHKSRSHSPPHRSHKKKKSKKSDRKDDSE
ncbi:pre-mRNA 3'-end-processing factor FIP1 [Diaphorina citri]|uniref:Pre-mRNA 3'-end-processing factor FIP1 n=1 Tax=Diaphorina citri TaxID=121845 RepID=A0A1S4ENN9_DIACI|nr:pre-mRNA 3'-end-processing factor FIP1 [Diaphorina citri]